MASVASEEYQQISDHDNLNPDEPELPDVFRRAPTIPRGFMRCLTDDAWRAD